LRYCGCCCGPAVSFLSPSRSSGSFADKGRLIPRKRKRPRSFLNVAFIYAGNDLLSHTGVARAPSPAKRLAPKIPPPTFREFEIVTFLLCLCHRSIRHLGAHCQRSKAAGGGARSTHSLLIFQ
jgi:hypothetical protein